MAPVSEPAFGGVPAHQPAPAAYSVQPGNDATNRAAQAGNVAAHHAEADQGVQHGIPKSKSKRIDESNIAKLVAEEAASKSKFPKYPGLEKWELLEKMGDGAFSNVYRARDLEGKMPGEVAIKVVRKFEMSSMQVSCCYVAASHHQLSARAKIVFVSFPFLWPSLLSHHSSYQPSGAAKIGKQASASGFQTQGSQSCRGAQKYFFIG